MNAKDRIIIALDVETTEKAKEIVADLSGSIGAFKVGKELFTSMGPSVVKEIVSEGEKVFLDLKYHDIPNTVKGACRAAARLGVFMLNVHASGGSTMIKAAVEGAADGAEGEPPIVLAVTVLTSIDEETLKSEMRVPFSPIEQVVFLAKLTQDAGADGVVCSPQEAEAVRSACGSDFVIVTPGIRPEWSVRSDQKRVTTPGKAVEMGADYMVIGRPVREAQDRKEAVKLIIDELTTL